MNTPQELPEEYHLALRAREGDTEALSRLAEIARPVLFATAYATLRHYDDAQDAVATALLRVCRHIGSLRDPLQVRGWMQQIVRNEARRQQTTPILYIEQEISEPLDNPPHLLRLDVERALRTLPTDQARAAALFYLDGVSIAEIGIHLSRPPGTIKYWLFRTRAHLSAHLKGYTSMSETTPTMNAAILSSALPPAFVAQLTDALRSAGWANVRFVSDFASLAEITYAGNEPRLRIVNPAPDCRCLILDTQMDGHSAFEIAQLLRSAPEGKDIGLFLLGDGTEGEAETQLSVLSAYMAGFDMCLMKPFEMAEFQRFALRLREALGEIG